MAEEMEQGKRSTAKWVVGCGLGCLAAIAIVAIGVGIASYFGWRYAATQGKVHMASQTERQYQEWLSENEMPAEYAEDYNALVAQMQQDATSLWGVMTGSAFMMTTLRDNVVTPEEAQNVAAFKDHLAANPDMSMMDMQGYMEAHPELQEAMQDFQKGATPGQDLSEEPKPMPVE
jgi:hypothetical protein